VDDAGGWLESTRRNSEGPSSRPRGSGRQSGKLNDRDGGSGAGLQDLGDGPRTRAADVGGVS